MSTFREYERADGSTFIVGRAVGGRFVVVGYSDHYATRREAVAAGFDMADDHAVAQ